MIGVLTQGAKLACWASAAADCAASSTTLMFEPILIDLWQEGRILMTAGRTHGAFDINAIVKRFPASADTMLVDTRLTDEPEASCRVFRIYRDVPPHYHSTCDEYLFVVSGRGTIFLGKSAPFEVSPGQLVFFKKGTVHGLTVIEEPFAFLSVDTPRRDPKDITFVNPSDGTAETFIKTRSLY
jgi:mannose-6-phosphate isomerase-like protein (cupin superfamily)